MKTTAAPLVVRALEEEGVRFTFGIPGTHNIELYDALAESRQITPVLVTDEQAASFMADGVSRASGTLGVVNLVPGAGVTHALSGIAEAFMDNVPLLVLTCGIRTDTGRAYQLHAIDQLAVLRPVTKSVCRVDSADRIYATVREACRLAVAGCPGPVAVEIPANFYLLRQDVPEPGPVESTAALPLSPVELDRAADLLRGSAQVLIYAGNGVRAAQAKLVQLAERLAAPVATTIQGKGVFPEHHPLFLWNGLGRSAPGFVREIERRADCMIAVGCRFSEVATASYGFEPPSRLIHIDIDSNVFNRNYPAEVTVPGDAGEVLAAILERVAARPRNAELEERIRRGHEELASERAGRRSAGRVTPALLFEALQRRVGPDSIFATDSGNGTFLAMEHLRLDRPGRFLAPVDYSCMGYSVPAAIGAKLALPDRDVVALAGDGALLMTGLELATASAYGAGVVVLVLRDGELAQIAQFQRTTLNRAPCSQVHPYDLESLAAAVRCDFARIASDDEAGAVLEQALAGARDGRTTVVEVAIDYGVKTYFTKGVVMTNFWRLPWSERLRLLTRALARRLPG